MAIVKDAIDGERMFLPSTGNNNHMSHIVAYARAVPRVVGKKVTDLCCGTGYGTRMLSEAAENVLGIDYSESAIAYNNTRPMPNVVYGLLDIENMGRLNTEIITCMQGLEHLDNPKQLIQDNLDKTWIIAVPNDGDDTNIHHHHKINENMIYDWFNGDVSIEYFDDFGNFSSTPPEWYTNFYCVHEGK